MLLDSPQRLVYGDWRISKKRWTFKPISVIEPSEARPLPSLSSNPEPQPGERAAPLGKGGGTDSPSLAGSSSSVSGSLRDSRARQHERLRGRTRSPPALPRAARVGGGGPSGGERAAAEPRPQRPERTRVGYLHELH